MAHYSYSFNNIVCIVGGITVEGWSDDANAISISYIDEQINQIVGADGDTVTSLIKNYQANITLSLNYGSPTNEIFSKIITGYRAGIIVPTPLLIKDNSGQDLHSSAHVNLVKNPDTNYGANNSAIVWELRSPELISYNGGGNRLA